MPLLYLSLNFRSFAMMIAKTILNFDIYNEYHNLLNLLVMLFCNGNNTSSVL